MNKLILLYTLLFSGVFLVNGARSDSDVILGSISGRVIDNVRKQPVAYAAIVIKLASDKTIITGGITNEDGTFQIKKLPDGVFILEVQFIGYKAHKQEITLSKEKRNVELGDIILEEEPEELSGIEVVAELTTIEQRIDRKVVNLGARYNFAQGKGTFSVNFNDVFNTMRFAVTGDQPFAQVGEFNWESQTVFAGISYRFGSGKNKAVKRKRRDANTKQSGGGIL